jgi:hypothetical protein
MSNISSMKKAGRKALDELRSEYKRSDFGMLVRGKYAARLAREPNIGVLESTEETEKRLATRKARTLKAFQTTYKNRRRKAF